jgi:glutamate-1-semialdehyde 2,1-aminomutase
VIGPLVGLFLSPGGPIDAPVDYVTAHALASNGVYPRFFHAMLRRGVALAPGAYEVMFPGLSHGDDVLDRVVAASGESAAEVAKELADAQP